MDEDYIDWPGGEMPVASGTFVNIVHRNGQSSIAQPADAYPWTHAPNFNPKDRWHAGWWDIVKYKPFITPEA